MKKFRNVILTILTLTMMVLTMSPLGGTKPPSIVDSINYPQQTSY